MPTRTTTASGSSRSSASRLASALAPFGAALLLTGCPPDPEQVQPVFPADYEATYREVRNCRRSIDHDNMFIRVLADPAAYDPFLGRDRPFPVGAVVLKLEYADETCTDLDRFSAIRKEAAGFDPASGDWYFQRVDLRREVTEDHPERCYRCHMACGVPPDGYDFTCTVEP